MRKCPQGTMVEGTEGTRHLLPCGAQRLRRLCEGESGRNEGRKC